MPEKYEQSTGASQALQQMPISDSNQFRDPFLENKNKIELTKLTK